MAKKQDSQQNPTGKIRDKEQRLVQRIAQERESVFERFPLPFTLLGAFGIVATFYGFERLIDQIEVLANNPLIMLVLGLSILAFTGTLYQYLQ